MAGIKVLFYAGDLDYAGTWRSHERIIETLDRTRFEPYVMYWDRGTNPRLSIVQEMIGEDRAIPFKRSRKKWGKWRWYAPWTSNFHGIAGALGCDIMHYKRSGYPEWPFNKRVASLQIETNVFGYRDTSPYLDRSIAINNYIRDYRGARIASFTILFPRRSSKEILSGSN